MTLPKATPKISAGTSPLTEMAVSQVARHARVLDLAAELDGYRPQDQRGEDDEHRQIKAGERRRVKHRPRRKDRATPENRAKPDCLPIPGRWY